MAAAAIPATVKSRALDGLHFGFSFVVPIVASGELLPLWPFSDLSGTDPWLVSQWVFAGSGETDGCRIEILFCGPIVAEPARF